MVACTVNAEQICCASSCLLLSERALSNCSNQSATCLWSAFNSSTASTESVVERSAAPVARLESLRAAFGDEEFFDGFWVADGMRDSLSLDRKGRRLCGFSVSTPVRAARAHA